ncbi:hypothetical protein [Fulvivirga sediminis]|uniref:Uncharacterized protein n=1 Tax=Fulvivirga sediminis TaxID=2803949 RepID=A0A937F963_9BACT|nr:hypothetical protein [Fulvivirga sediminis]MBL3656924.1 hypothetical protein [Fulvivirga sediminis]
MIFRNGQYTKYKGFHLMIQTIRDDDDKIILIWIGKDCPLKQFYYEKAEDGFVSIIDKNELTNAYLVKTFGYYKGYKFQIFSRSGSSEVSIATSELLAYQRLSLIKIAENWFGEDVMPNELESTWEEYFETLNLPLPDDIQLSQ